MRARASLIFALALLASIAGAQDFAPGELLVKLRGRAPSSTAIALGAKVVEHLSSLGVERMRLPRSVDVRRAMLALQADSAVSYVEPNYRLQLFGVNDPYYSKQWALTKILAPQAWTISCGSPNVLVAVLDTGADLAHPELIGKIADSQNFTGIGPAQDGNGHGSHTAGIVAAATNNGFDIASLGYNTDLLIGKVADDSGKGTVATVANGITWAVSHGAKVISMSLGITSFSSTLRDAVDLAWNHGIVVVAAAGNYGGTDPVYPAAYEHCIAVAATDQLDRRCSFSTYGSWVHVSAPGLSILSLYKRGGLATMSGTSMAAPHVAALAALLWANGAISNVAIRAAIENSGDPSTGFGAYPAPRINARRALLRFP